MAGELIEGPFRISAALSYSLDAAGVPVLDVAGVSASGTAVDLSDHVEAFTDVHGIPDTSLLVAHDGAGNVALAGTLTASVLESDVADGTPPLVVTSTTLIPNLNADRVDGLHAAYLLDLANATGNLPHGRLPSGAGTWALGGPLTLTGGDVMLSQVTSGTRSFTVQNANTAGVTRMAVQTGTANQMLFFDMHGSAYVTAGPRRALWGVLAAGTAANGLALATLGAKPVEIWTNNMLRMAVDSAGSARFYGALQVDGQFTSSVASGTAPLSVASTTVCPNLNADLLDGLHASAFAQLAGSNQYSGTQGVIGATAAQTGFEFKVSGDLSLRVAVLAGGPIVFGSGSNISDPAWHDLRIHRTAAKVLTIDDGADGAAALAVLGALTVGTTLTLTNPGTATTVGAAGAAAALPANPVGYVTATIAGTPRKIPYYNT